MMSTHDDLSGDDWTADERDLFASLAHERTPPPELKARVADAVHQQLSPAPLVAAPRSYALILAAAAAIVIFIAGTVVGYAAARRTPPIGGATHAASRENVASAKRDSASINQMRYVVWY